MLEGRKVLRFIAFSETAFLFFPWLHTVLYWLPVFLHSACSAVNWFFTAKYNILMFVEFVAQKASCVWDKLQLTQQLIWPSILKDNYKYTFKIISTAKTKHTQNSGGGGGKEKKTPQQKPAQGNVLPLFIHTNEESELKLDLDTVWEGGRNAVVCLSLNTALSLVLICLRTINIRRTGVN